MTEKWNGEEEEEEVLLGFVFKWQRFFFFQFYSKIKFIYLFK